MKHFKYFLLITFLSVGYISYSQEHLKFKNIPIDGKMTDYSKELSKLGFTIDRTDDNIMTLTGEFANKTCEILVIGSTKSQLTWKVVVKFPEESSWSSIKSNYFELKELMSKKYGDGKTYEFFSKPY